MIPFSILDLSPIGEGKTAAEALKDTRALSQQADRLGYHRYWLAEHHNMPGIASAATSVVIGYVAEGTERIRVGSGGIMLPNHSPLVIAEQFGTLESLYPGRIDLGLGRAPGTDMMTARALRRDMAATAERFPQDVQELLAYFAEPQSGQQITAVPGAGLNVPIWLLGSSLYSAQLAAMLGLPFAFASHFAPADMLAAETDQEARYHFSSQQQSFVNLRRGMPGRVPKPIEDIESFWSPMEKIMVEQALKYSFVGAPDKVEQELASFLAEHQPDELMITALVHDNRARLKTLELVAEIQTRLS